MFYSPVCIYLRHYFHNIDSQITHQNWTSSHTFCNINNYISSHIVWFKSFRRRSIFRNILCKFTYYHPHESYEFSVELMTILLTKLWFDCGMLHWIEWFDPKTMSLLTKICSIERRMHQCRLLHNVVYVSIPSITKHVNRTMIVLTIKCK